MIKWFTFSRKSDDDFVIRIFKSEYVEIERQTRLFPEIETGGDLFGTFTHGSLPVIWFVTGPGKRATHNFAEFSQDPEYITYMQRILMAKYGIQYIGSWHSHHKLGLRTPSSGDVRNAQSYARRHNRKQTIEIIVTYKNKDYQNGLDVTPFFYPDAQRSGWAEAKFTFLPGMSPIRELERQSNTTPDNKLPVVRTSGNEEIIDYLAQKIKDQNGSRKKYLHQGEIIENLNSIDDNEGSVGIPIPVERAIAELSERNIDIEVEVKNENVFIVLMAVNIYKHVAVAFELLNKSPRVVQVNLIDYKNNINKDITNKLIEQDVLQSKEHRDNLLLKIFDYAKRNTGGYDDRMD